MAIKEGQDPKTGRFLPGNSGFGGRPKGSRNKLGEQFLEDLLEAWRKDGPEVIDRVFRTKPEVALKVIASILPKEVNLKVDPLDEMSKDELVERLTFLDRQIRPYLTTHAGESEGGGGSGEAPPIQ